MGHTLTWLTVTNASKGGQKKSNKLIINCFCSSVTVEGKVFNQDRNSGFQPREAGSM